jgi:hypothetical protein
MATQYNNSLKLSENVADLYGFSRTNHNRIAELIKTAKAALGIDSKAKRMPDDMQRLIWRWHVDKVCALKTKVSVESVGEHESELKTKRVGVPDTVDVISLGDENVLSTETEQENELSTDIESELKTKPNPTKEVNKGGRPRKHKNDAARMKAYRSEQKRKGKAVLLTLDFTTHRYIKILAKAWGCSAADVIARWGKELEPKYENILYPPDSAGSEH